MDYGIFFKKIVELDPTNEIVKIDLDNKKIKYSNKIIQHRVISKITGEEELVRAYFVVKLIKELGYEQKDIELEKEYEAGRPKKIKPRIDILLKDRRDNKENTFLFIEVKAPDKFDKDREYIRTQLFELAKLEDKKYPISYLVYSTAFLDTNNNVNEKNIIIDYKAYSDFDEWENDGKLSLDILPKDYGEPRKVKYVKGVTDLDTKVSKSEFDFIRKDLHDVLWGGGGTNYNDIFVNLVKIFLAKIYDENNTNKNEAYKFQIEYIGNKPETSDKVFSKVNDLYLKGCKAYLGYSDEDLKNETLNKKTISANKVRYVVEQLQGISLTQNETNNNDILGDFFESIVTEGFKQDKGQFFTHTNIVKFLIFALEIDDFAINSVNESKTLPYICDPSCGSGTFLIEVMKIITDTIKRKRNDEIKSSTDVQLFVNYKMPDVKENTWAWDYLYGIEINPDLALATKVNMVLHGDGSGNIFSKDALKPFKEFQTRQKISVISSEKLYENYSYKKTVNEQFDFIISNPPFSIKLDKETKKQIPKLFQFATANKSENLFIERYYQLLKEGGKAGIVLPESVLDTNDNRKFRLFIYKFFKIEAIISLSGGKNGAFLPYTPIKTSLLLIKKKSKNEVEKFDEKWRELLNEFNRLKRKVDNIINEKYKGEDAKEILIKFLDTQFKKDDYLTSEKIVEKYSNEITEISKNKDWWIFSNISRLDEFNYKIFISHTDKYGYHRTKNREFKRENELYLADKNGNVIINKDNPKKIIDYIKSKKEISTPNKFYISFNDISKSINLRVDHRFHRYKIFEEPIILDTYKKTPIFLREVIKDIRNGKDVKRELYSTDANGNIIETNYKYLTINNINENKFIIDDIINLLPKKGKELVKFAFKYKELIVTRSGTVGLSKVFDIKDDENYYIPSGYLTVLELDEEKVNPYFMELFLNSPIMKKYFEIFGTGKTQRNIAQGDIEKIPYPSFSKIEQDEILKDFMEVKKIVQNKIDKKRNEIMELETKIDTELSNKFLKDNIDIELEE